MKDLTIELNNQPGAIAQMGEVLSKVGVSLEGGGAWLANGTGIAHFLVEDSTAACQALAAAGIKVIAVKPVLVQRLKQEVPGQLGLLCRMMADAGVNIETAYSDHDNQFILVVDDMKKGQVVSDLWKNS